MRRLIILILYLLIHFLVLREVRALVFSWQINEALKNQIEDNESISITTIHTRLIYFQYQAEPISKLLQYKISFGFFFLLSIIGLVLYNADKKYFLFLIGFHLLDILLSTLVLKTSPFIGFKLLIICDFMSRYMIPLISIGIIPIAVFSKKSEKSES